MRKNAHFAVHTGQDDNIYIIFKNFAILRDYFTSNWHIKALRRSILGIREFLIPNS